MQVTGDRSAAGDWAPYAETTRFSGALPAFARVRDFAGNASPWCEIAAAPGSAPETVAPFPRQAVLAALRRTLASVRRRHGRLGLRALSRRRVLGHRLCWPTAGTATFRWRATVDGRRITLAHGSRTITAAGAASVRVRSTRPGRRLLRRARRVRVTVTGVFRQGSDSASVRTAFTLRR
jgi:hypothetical protein